MFTFKVHFTNNEQFAVHGFHSVVSQCSRMPHNAPNVGVGTVGCWLPSVAVTGSSSVGVM